MKRLRTLLTAGAGVRFLRSAFPRFARRSQLALPRLVFLEFRGIPILVKDAGPAGSDGFRDVIVTFRVCEWFTAPVAKFVIVQTRVPSVSRNRFISVQRREHCLVRVTAPAEAADRSRSIIPHCAVVTTIAADAPGVEIEISAASSCGAMLSWCALSA